MSYEISRRAAAVEGRRRLEAWHREVSRTAGNPFGDSPWERYKDPHTGLIWHWNVADETCYWEHEATPYVDSLTWRIWWKAPDGSCHYGPELTTDPGKPLPKVLAYPGC